MCNCKDIDFGSYDRQTSMLSPWVIKNALGERKKGIEGHTWVCIDTCLVQEIAELWHLGIKTIECCCGHNKKEGYIMVEKENISTMVELGYQQEKTHRVNTFIPKRQ